MIITSLHRSPLIAELTKQLLVFNTFRTTSQLRVFQGKVFDRVDCLSVLVVCVVVLVVGLLGLLVVVVGEVVVVGCSSLWCVSGRGLSKLAEKSEINKLGYRLLCVEKWCVLLVLRLLSCWWIFSGRSVLCNARYRVKQGSGFKAICSVVGCFVGD